MHSLLDWRSGLLARRSRQLGFLLVKHRVWLYFLSASLYLESREKTLTNLELPFHPLLVFCTVLLLHRLVVLDGFNELGLDKCGLNCSVRYYFTIIRSTEKPLLVVSWFDHPDSNLPGIPELSRDASGLHSEHWYLQQARLIEWHSFAQRRRPCCLTTGNEGHQSEQRCHWRCANFLE
jgi:hypothetical protein